MKNVDKRTWIEWATYCIDKNNMCPGRMPTIVNGNRIDPDQLITFKDFQVLMRDAGLDMHDHNTCGHYRNEILGLELPESGMVEIKGVDAHSISSDDLSILKHSKACGVDRSAIIRLRRDLHHYVDAIELRDGGKLYVPRNLLKLNTYLKEFFDIKGA